MFWSSSAIDTLVREVDLPIFEVLDTGFTGSYFTASGVAFRKSNMTHLLDYKYHDASPQLPDHRQLVRLSHLTGPKHICSLSSSWRNEVGATK